MNILFLICFLVVFMERFCWASAPSPSGALPAATTSQTIGAAASAPPTIVNQIDLFNAFAAQSWQMKKHAYSDRVDRTPEEFLVEIFNTKDWFPKAGNAEKITPSIPDLKALQSLVPLKITFAGTKTLFNDDSPKNWGKWKVSQKKFSDDDSPEKWMDKIQYRELIRLKEFLTQYPFLINDADFKTDDLVKARALSGIFWVVDDDGGAEKAFSGMLVPGQAFGLTSYQVITCLHGFNAGNKSNNVSYYFVPYGVTANSRLGTKDYVVNKGFKVTRITHYRGKETNLSIDDPFFNEDSLEIQYAKLYSENDFAIAMITGAVDTISLRDALVNTGLNMVTAQDSHLFKLSGDIEFLSTGLNVEVSRLFTIGFAAEPAFELSNGMIISTTLKNDDVTIDAPLRSLSGDQNVKKPPNKGRKTEEAASSLAIHGGMSGGPVLQCRFDPYYYPVRRKCKIIGTNWGDGRIFDESGKVIAFRSIANKLLN